MTKVVNLLGWLFAAALLLFALLSIIVRITMANLDLAIPEVENWLNAEVIQGISLTSAKGKWRGWNPVLQLKDISLTLPDKSQPLILNGAKIELDLLQSLWQLQPVIRRLHTSIDILKLHQNDEQQWFINDILLNPVDKQQVAPKISSILAQLPQEIGITIDRLILHKQQSRQDIEINKLSLNIHNKFDQVDIQLDANIQSNTNQFISLSARLKSKQVSAYLKSSNIEILPWLEMANIPLNGLKEFGLSGESWLSWHDGQELKTMHQLDINGKANNSQSEVEIPFSFSALVKAEKTQDLWHLENKFNRFQVANNQLDPFQLSLRFDRSDQQSISGWINQLSLQQLRPVIQVLLPEEAASKLHSAAISADLTDFRFSIPLQNVQAAHMGFQFDNWSNQGVQQIPAMNNLRGEVVFGNQHLMADVDGKNMEVDLGSLFPAPLMLDQLQLQLSAHFDESGFQLALNQFLLSNTDIQSEGRLWLEMDQANEPFLYLRMQIDRGDASATAKYLPEPLLPAATLEWLQENIKEGQISNGELLFHGRLIDIAQLDDQLSGTLFAEFDINNPLLGTAPDWPGVKNGSAHIQFENLGFRADVKQVKFSHIPVEQASVTIENLTNVSIRIRAQSENDVTKALQTFLDIPPGANFKVIQPKIKKLYGKVHSEWDIFIPLEEPDFSNIKVEGILTFKQAGFRAPNWGLKIDRMNGDLNIFNSNISAEKLTADFFGDPVSVDIVTDKKRNRTNIHTEGKITTRNLTKLIPQEALSAVHGSSDWKVDVSINNSPNLSDLPFLEIQAQSLLQGTSFDYPAPFNKSSSISKNLKLELLMAADDSVDFDVLFGQGMSTRGSLVQDKNGHYKLNALDLALRQPLKTRPISGINIYGSMSSLNWRQWSNYINSDFPQKSDEEIEWLNLIQSIQLRIDNLDIYGYSYSSFVLDAEKSGKGVSGTLDSSGVKGRFIMPSIQNLQVPIELTLDYLTLGEFNPNDEESTLLPSDIPSLNLHSKVVNYKELVFTDLEVDTLIYQNSVILKKLSIKRDDVLLVADGLWQYLPAQQEHSTQLSVTIKGNKIGETIHALGIGDELQKGKIDFKGHLSWLDRPMDLDWNSLVGKAFLNLEDGVFTNIEPGAGRLVGLLSVSSLWRRLTLDFKDVAEQGLLFDKIKGEYEIQGEQLIINKTKIVGPASTIRVKGSANIRNRKYDQQIFIIPKIRQTLPILGTIAATNTVGWVLLLLQKVFEDDIDKSVEIKYSVTGDWDEPVVKLIAAQPTIGKIDDSDIFENDDNSK